MERELGQLEGRLGQRADQNAQERLAGLGEAAAIRVLRKIGESRQPVRNLSAYIHFMANLDDSECAAASSGTSRPDYARSPAHSTPYGSQQYQKGTGSAVRHAVFSPPRTRMDSTPSPVRNITKSFSQFGVSETRPTPPGMKTSEPLANANEFSATASHQMVALGELDFHKIFLIYVYLAGNKIEDVCELHEEYIRSLHPLPMDEFEPEIWHTFGQKFIPVFERRQNLNWDPMKPKVYHCYIEKRHESIVTIFKGPYVEHTRNHLNKVVGDDNVLVVKFSAIPGITDVTTYFNCYRQVAQDGIILGLRRYRFLIYKDGRSEGKGKNDGNQKFSSSVKCYFVRTESEWDRDTPYILSDKTIDEARKLFMNIDTTPTVAKYLSRFSLILSKTTTLLGADDLSNVEVIIDDDVPCKDENGKTVLNHGEALIHTDGTGLISEDLAMKCPTSVVKGNILRTHDLQPLLMQIRMFYDGLAAKGTLLVDRRLPDRTIRIRRSMIKVTSDPNLLHEQSFNSLEVVATSNRPKRAFTSRYLIMLLHYGGVPTDCFLELLGKAIKDAEKSFCKTSDFLEVAYNHAGLDDFMSARMILAKIQPDEDAYLQYQLRKMTQEEREGLKLGRIPIDDSYNLMGATDPTGKLKPNEVCVIHDNGQISGEVLVYRHPGLHFGDVHVLTATSIPNLEKIFVGYSKYVILFPTSGPRSLADEMAGGDYDGDNFFVSRNPQLLEHFRPSEPWVQRNPPRKTEQKNPRDEPQLEYLLFFEFLKARFTPSYVTGMAADSWLAHMDQLLTGEAQANKIDLEQIRAKMLELVDIYYEALDAPKTGNKIYIPDELRVKKFPHYMDQKTHSYHSTSVLGKIYDEAVSRQSEIPPINISLLRCFTEEAELVTHECRELWTSRYQDYRNESSALYDPKYSKEERDSRFSRLYQKYREMLYDAAEFEKSRRGSELFAEASVIYQIVYEYALRKNNPGLCGFAWKVAGRALCELHAIKHGGETMLCSNSVLQDAFKRNR